MSKKNKLFKSNKSKTIAFVIIFGMLVFGGLSTLFLKPNNPQSGNQNSNLGSLPVVDPSGLPGIRTTSAPWPPEINSLLARLSAINLPALSQEGTALHIHQHLDVSIEGKKIPVPADIGIDTQGGFISPIHTHDGTGIIHVESPTVRNFYLGQFFDIWGVRFTSQCLGSYCAGGENKLEVFVNGLPVASDPRDVLLTPHEEIFVFYGTAAQLPKTIPVSYAFPAGL
ncbi:MAG TPA: hypothetical protein VMU70_01190 [Candidatus Tyrphobacter sp.]|nr:hypothetical protein [Candidatus Tyrphobacter sp.]